MNAAGVDECACCVAADRWQRLAERYQDLHGINWDQVLIEGSKEPSKKGAP